MGDLVTQGVADDLGNALIRLGQLPHEAAVSFQEHMLEHFNPTNNEDYNEGLVRLFDMYESAPHE